MIRGTTEETKQDISVTSTIYTCNEGPNRSQALTIWYPPLSFTISMVFLISGAKFVGPLNSMYGVISLYLFSTCSNPTQGSSFIRPAVNEDDDWTQHWNMRTYYLMCPGKATANYINNEWIEGVAKPVFRAWLKENTRLLPVRESPNPYVGIRLSSSNSFSVFPITLITRSYGLSLFSAVDLLLLLP